jgi:hypothetical protein
VRPGHIVILARNCSLRDRSCGALEPDAPWRKRSVFAGDRRRPLATVTVTSIPPSSPRILRDL